MVWYRGVSKKIKGTSRTMDSRQTMNQQGELELTNFEDQLPTEN